MKRIKVFLGGYVNYPNAQNINCEKIARCLDKNTFEVHTLFTPRHPIQKNAYKKMGINLHRVIHNRFLMEWSKLFFLWWTNCDIYYLPKREWADGMFARMSKQSSKVFVASVEGVVTATIGNSSARKKYCLEDMDDIFSISNCIQESVLRLWKKETEVLHLGVESKGAEPTVKTNVGNVVWIGSIIQRKRPQYLLEVAKRFPRLQFTMIGDGDMMPEIEERIAEEGIGNVKLTGRIPNEQVYAHMRQADLLLMTSEFEGLPKVIQEAAQCGLPSIYMAENYTVDFLEDGVNGYGVHSLEEMCEKLAYLCAEPHVYRAMSAKAYEIIQAFTWERLIPKYEDYFLRVLEKKRNAVRDGEV